MEHMERHMVQHMEQQQLLGQQHMVDQHSHIVQ